MFPTAAKFVGSNNSTPSRAVTLSPFLISQPSVSSGRVPPTGALGNELMYGSIDGDGDVSLPLF